MSKIKKVGSWLFVAYVAVAIICYNVWHPTPDDTSIPYDMLVHHGVGGIGQFLKSLLWPYFLLRP